MDYYLKSWCECGGDVIVITNTETSPRTGKREAIVSHGTCIKCMENYPMPNDTIKDFLAQFKRDEYYFV